MNKDNSLLDSILLERGSRYGSFENQANLSQTLKKAVYDHLLFSNVRLANDQAEAIEMILHKVARICNGDPNYIDSWDDIGGYSKLVADRLRGNQKDHSTNTEVVLAKGIQVT